MLRIVPNLEPNKKGTSEKNHKSTNERHKSETARMIRV